MLFNELLLEKHKLMSPWFDKLFDRVIKNQTHESDLLLVMENALLTTEPDYDDNGAIKNFFSIGPDMEGHCEHTNYDFITRYVNDAPNVDHKAYLDFMKYDSQKVEQINELESGEAITVQTEMLIYLKIWEGETFLKKWYQLSRLAAKEDYDWHFSIRSKQTGPYGSMARYQVNAAIKENLLSVVPELHDIWIKTQIPQIRNAIAHSQYAILGRQIMFNNFEKDREGSLGGMSFNDWIELFHTTLVIFNLINRFFRKTRDYYYDKSLPLKESEIRINRRHPDVNQIFHEVHTREFFKDWSPYRE